MSPVQSNGESQAGAIPTLRIVKPEAARQQLAGYIRELDRPISEREAVEFLYPSLRAANYLLYAPVYDYDEEDLIFWPRRGWYGKVSRKVAGKFPRLRIEWDERVSKDFDRFRRKHREVTVTYMYTPRGPRPPRVADFADLDDEEVLREDLYEICREETREALLEDASFVCFGNEWCLREMMPDVSVQHLGLMQQTVQSAEDVVTVPQLVATVFGLDPSDPSYALQAFSVNVAMDGLPGVQHLSSFEGGEWASDAYVRERENWLPYAFAENHVRSGAKVPYDRALLRPDVAAVLEEAEEEDALLALGRKSEVLRPLDLWESIGRVLSLSPAERTLMTGTRRPIIYCDDTERTYRCFYVEPGGNIFGLEDWIDSLAPGVFIQFRTTEEGQFWLGLQDGICELSRFVFDPESRRLAVGSTVRVRAAVDPWLGPVLANPELVCQLMEIADDATSGIEDILARLFEECGPVLNVKNAMAVLRFIERPGRRSLDRAAAAILSVSSRFQPVDGSPGDFAYVPTALGVPSSLDKATFFTLTDLDRHYDERIKFFREQGELGREWRRGELVGKHVRGLKRRPHTVRPHLRRTANPSPEQLELGRLAGLRIPPSYTFVRGHRRGR